MSFHFLSRTGIDTEDSFTAGFSRGLALASVHACLSGCSVYTPTPVQLQLPCKKMRIAMYILVRLSKETRTCSFKIRTMLLMVSMTITHDWDENIDRMPRTQCVSARWCESVREHCGYVF